jgi:hypothetical protein
MVGEESEAEALPLISSGPSAARRSQRGLAVFLSGSMGVVLLCAFAGLQVRYHCVAAHCAYVICFYAQHGGEFKFDYEELNVITSWGGAESPASHLQAGDRHVEARPNAAPRAYPYRTS